MYIVLAIIIFGLLIVTHEIGHFVAAKKLGVKVNEFAFGMGPKLWSKQRGETLYAWRLLPIGGACVMEGEDADTPDPRAFTAAKRWKRVVILAAGAVMNFLTGLIIVLILGAGIKYIAGTTVDHLAPGFPNEGADGLMAGDKLYAINGNRLYYDDDFSLFMQLPDATDGAIDLTIVRGGEKITLRDFPLAPREYTEDGETRVRYGLSLNAIEPTAGAKLKYSLYTAFNFARIVKVSLVQLITGNAGLRDMSGPVGIVTVINEAASSPQLKDTGERLRYVFNLAALIAVNLAVMNLLPIPALDGGRIFGLFVTFVIEKITRKRVDPKYEGYVHGAGLALLLILMVVIMVSDIMKLL
ncbi:MAG: site-2 protease family protein [Oscillospiraceae bacterium]|jgi:regulator of sigma E protease|nr:site-2 protease family protein [Oscillospiraceae bacterium]